MTSIKSIKKKVIEKIKHLKIKHGRRTSKKAREKAERRMWIKIDRSMDRESFTGRMVKSAMKRLPKKTSRKQTRVFAKRRSYLEKRPKSAPGRGSKRHGGKKRGK